MKQVLFLLLHLISQPLIQSKTKEAYDEARQAVLTAEEELMTGGHTHLSTAEAEVDDIFMQHKLGELSRGFHDADLNAAAMHFFKAKILIQQSGVFHFLQKMPKGAVLHLHNTASVSSKWVVKKLTYMKGLLRCTTATGLSVLTFRRTPKEHKCQSDYVSIADERKKSTDREAYDRNIERLFNLYTPVPELEYPTITRVWDRFQNIFSVLGDALSYLPAFRDYHWQMLEELYLDNVMYAEIRTSCKKLYDADGRVFSKERTMRELYALNLEFVKLHPEFIGIKLIYSVHRGYELDRLKTAIKEFKELQEALPEFVVGFDLVGQEDKGKPLYNLLPAIADLPKKTRLFFHAGETNWFGASTDLNLVDALLLNSSRIGHGYALVKHPVLMHTIKERQVAIEVSPISNQVLRLVSDLRNHPGAELLALNVSVVICNDDPGYWNAKGLSYDFYYAIMSMAPNNAGLKTLKALVWNSVRFSAMTKAERRRAYNILEVSWARFIKKALHGNVL